MMYANSKLLLAALVLIAAPPVAGAESPEPRACAEPAVDAIQKRYESVSDLRAEFVQVARSVALSGASRATSQSHGTVVFAKPGKMRWSYEGPEPSLVVSDGKTLWIYDPVHAEVQRTSVTEGFLSGAALQFLLGEGDIRRDFQVTAVACEADAALLELVPRKDATYEKLQVSADLATGELRRTVVFDLLGNVTEVQFADIRENQRPAESVFRFEPPEGVEVIDLDAP